MQKIKLQFTWQCLTGRLARYQMLFGHSFDRWMLTHVYTHANCAFAMYKKRE